MDSIKRILGFLLVLVISINYLIPFLHSFEHEEMFEVDSDVSIIHFEQDENISEQCCCCDVYFSIDYSEFQYFNISLAIPDPIFIDILDFDDKITSVLSGKEKSRAPPISFT